MTYRSVFRTLRLSLACACLTPCAIGQFSKNAAQQLALAAGDSQQERPRLALASDGQVYAAWFDEDPNSSVTFGFDLRLQRLDPQGRLQWPANGVLVAERGFAETQDYGLATDEHGNALLAFRDDRGSGVQITIAKIAPDGSQLLGPLGQTLTATSDFVATPTLAVASDGAIVAAWSQNVSVHLQSLEPDGTPRWDATIQLPLPIGSAAVGRLAPSDAGAVIVSWLEQANGFLSPRRLVAQKFGADGTPQWTPTAASDGVALVLAGSLPLGARPELVPDDAGGAAFAWSTTGMSQSFVQRLDALGAPQFALGGVPAALGGSALRTDATLAFDALTERTYLAWSERAPGVSNMQPRAQSFDADGVPLWQADGVELEPSAPGTLGALWVLASESSAAAGAAFLWSRAQLGPDADVRFRFLDELGVPQAPAQLIASTPSAKAQFSAVRGAFGDAQVAWSDGPPVGADVLIQNVLDSGALGPAAGILPRGAPGNVDGYTATGLPQLGGSFLATVDVPPAPAAGLFGYFGAVQIPFPQGTLLVDVLSPAGELFNLPFQSGPIASFPIPIPNAPILCGRVLSTQAALLFPGGDVALTNAQDLYLGL